MIHDQNTTTPSGLAKWVVNNTRKSLMNFNGQLLPIIDYGGACLNICLFLSIFAHLLTSLSPTQCVDLCSDILIVVSEQRRLNKLREQEMLTPDATDENNIEPLRALVGMFGFRVHVWTMLDNQLVKVCAILGDNAQEEHINKEVHVMYHNLHYVRLDFDAHVVVAMEHMKEMGTVGMHDTDQSEMLSALCESILSDTGETARSISESERNSSNASSGTSSPTSRWGVT